MRKFLFLTTFLVSACATVQLRQGVEGRILWVAGNQMPGPGMERTTPDGIQRELHVYQPTTINDVSKNEEGFFTNVKTKRVAVINSTKDGSFKLRLPPGTYSVFVKEAEGLFANQFDQHYTINPVVVQEKQFTQLTVIVNYQAAY